MRFTLRTRQRGITRIELAAAVGLLGLILGGVVLILPQRVDAEKTESAVQDARRIHDAAVSFKHDNVNGCPTVTQLIHEKALSTDAHADDPWGSRFRVRCSNDGVSVSSPGRDGKLGTDDDIQVPRNRS